VFHGVRYSILWNSVARTDLSEAGAVEDSELLQAALLHDTIEDTDTICPKYRLFDAFLSVESLTTRNLINTDDLWPQSGGN